MMIIIKRFFSRRFWYLSVSEDANCFYMFALTIVTNTVTFLMETGLKTTFSENWWCLINWDIVKISTYETMAAQLFCLFSFFMPFFPRSPLPHNLDNLKMSHKILCMWQICPQGNNSGWSWAADAPLGPVLSGCGYFFYGVRLAGQHSKES